VHGCLVFQQELCTDVDERGSVFHLLIGQESQQGEIPIRTGAFLNGKPEPHAANATGDTRPSRNLALPPTHWGDDNVE